MGEGLAAPRGNGLRSRVCVRKAACRPERTGNGTRPLPPPGLRTESGRREETQTARPQPWRDPPRGVSLRRSPGQDVRPLRPAVPIVAPCPLSTPPPASLLPSPGVPGSLPAAGHAVTRAHRQPCPRARPRCPLVLRGTPTGCPLTPGGRTWAEAPGAQGRDLGPPRRNIQPAQQRQRRLQPVPLPDPLGPAQDPTPLLRLGLQLPAAHPETGQCARPRTRRRRPRGQTSAPPPAARARCTRPGRDG